MLVLVTGASRGIGFEMVKQLANNPGLFVIAVSRNIRPLAALVKEANTDNVLTIKADINKAADLKHVAAIIKKLNFKIDILINNAGHIVNKPFHKITREELTAVYSANVFAPFFLIQTLLPLFNTKTRSHIVNISSIGGIQGSSKFPGLSAYSSSKAALCGLSECLGEEFKTKNIAVNCLALGAVQTEMLTKAFPGYKAPLQPHQMAEYICNFALTAHNYFNGKIIPVSSTTP
ncbi:MAG: SDR family oxidoreductase [Bacteroidetes bacterium]|nr:SDR family oxidoreductase [Bacteroidota bacterium]